MYQPKCFIVDLSYSHVENYCESLLQTRRMTRRPFRFARISTGHIQASLLQYPEYVYRRSVARSSHTFGPWPAARARCPSHLILHLLFSSTWDRKKASGEPADDLFRPDNSLLSPTEMWTISFFFFSKDAATTRRVLRGIFRPVGPFHKARLSGAYPLLQYRVCVPLAQTRPVVADLLSWAWPSRQEKAHDSIVVNAYWGRASAGRPVKNGHGPRFFQTQNNVYDEKENCEKLENFD